ncbi:MAG: DUF1573 domain-containing protein [Planctomycetales bacterium]
MLLSVSGVLALPGCEGSKSAPAPAAVADAKAPKVEVDNVNHDFGAMQVGEEKEHTFVITNKGEGDLQLTPGTPTCKCTSFVVEKHLLKPGESTKSTVRWKPKEESDTFRQVAPIETNDPNVPKVQLNIVGIVRTKVSIRPGLEWDLGDVSESGEKEISGKVYTQVLDQLKIVEVKCSNPNIKVEVAPMSDTNLKKIPAKVGYDITLKFGNQVPIGEIKETLAIKTDAGEETHFLVDLKGRRPGPLRVLAPGFSVKRWTLNLGTFPAKEGTKREISMFYEGQGDIQIKEAQSDNPALKVNIRRDNEFKGRGQRIIAQFEVPSREKQELHTDATPVKVKIDTNQPTVGTINLNVLFNAQ